MDDCDRINAANLCTFLSMNFPKQYFVWYYANFIKENGDVEEVTRNVGATPLTKDDLEMYGIDNEAALWINYKNLYQKIMGHAFPE